MLYVLLGINIAFMVIGQIFFKKSSVFMETNAHVPLLMRYVQNAWLYAGLAAFGFATLVWIKVLSLERLSAVYPMQSVAYILVAIASFYLFGERLNVLNIVGIFTIILGVVLVSQR